MSDATDSELEASVESCELWSLGCGGLLLLGVLAEFILAALQPTLPKFWLRWGSPLADAAVFIGVAGELAFGRLGSNRQSELTRRSKHELAQIWFWRGYAEEEMRDTADKLSDAQRKLADAIERAAKANQAAEEARLELEKFKAPRKLTQAQKNQLISRLMPMAGQKYALSVATGQEPANFMCEIDTALKSAGWVQLPPIGSISVMTDCGKASVNTLSGVQVRVALKRNPQTTLGADLLGTALIEIGIPVRGGQDPENIFDPEMVLLMVGTKP